ncbi:MAG: PQQ-like beta-propeller repeat protein [Planctomycetia bacterium]|nr:PQQ-like beta-propeller repeat protein [Planctomycetia bacterium]
MSEISEATRDLMVRTHGVRPVGFAGVAIAALLMCAAPAPALAQRDFQVSAAPAAYLDVDPAASKMLGAARDFLAARQWGDAIDLLRQTADQHGDRLVAIEPGRFVNVQMSADILLSSLPAEGLKLYRAKTDPQARRWFDAAKKTRDVEGLERVVRKAFLSSYGDQALLLLGDLAWEQGALARARSDWEKLIPQAVPPDAGDVPVVLKYPDSRVPIEQVQARLVLCRLMQEGVEPARQELESFRRSFPDAKGRLAGENGNLAKTLEGVLGSEPHAPAEPPALDTATFAGNVERNQPQPRAFDVGAPLWSVHLKEMRVERVARPDEFAFDRADRGAAILPMRVLSYYPAVWNQVTFYCDETDVFAVDLAAARGGQPAWGNEASIYRLPQEHDQIPQAPRPKAGLPRFSVTIDGARLFARLGQAAVPPGRNRGFRQVGNSLVCLDLARQGDLHWIVKSDELETDGGAWVFDGAPVAREGRVYAALRRSDPQLQLNIACFDAGSARLLWTRKVCNGVEALGGDFDEYRHQLLTLAEERLYFNTNLGAIAALDSRDGSVLWASTYPRVEVETIAAFNKRQQYGPNPCLYHRGLLCVAPYDCESVLAFDAETGILKWSHEVAGKVPQLLGVTGSKLIAAGDFLWAIDVQTGLAVWRDGRSDPEGSTWGRGLLAGGSVYWPRREEIRIIDAATGKPLRQVELAQQHGLYGGGNLAIAGGMLLVAQSDRLVAFSEFGARKKPAKDRLALLLNDK